MKPAAGDGGTLGAAAAESSSSRSECSESGDGRESGSAGVRVSMDLRQFFSDRRARAFMWAPRARRVGWLARRVARVFRLPGDVALLSRGHLLPADEPLLLLDPRDPVQVVKMSYVLSPLDEQDDSNLHSNRIDNEISALTRHSRINVSSIHSEIPDEQDNILQLQTYKKGDDIVKDLIIPSLDYPMEDKNSNEATKSQTSDANEDLQRMKRQALRLLDEHCLSLQEGSAPKRVRRRRRRRRPRPAGPASAASGEDEPLSEEPPPGEAPPDPAAVVLRNGSGSRPPRLLRPLSPSPV